MPAEAPEFLYKALDMGSIDLHFWRGFEKHTGLFYSLYESASLARKEYPLDMQIYIIVILAKYMIADDYRLFNIAEGKWAVNEIPVKYIRLHGAM